MITARRVLLNTKLLSAISLFNSDEMQDLYFFSAATSAIIILLVAFIVIVFNR